MKKIILAVAVAAVATMALVGSASAGPAAGVTATPSATKQFNGSYTAKFTRASSGIINETNRVNSAGAQNDWSPYDVWLQFRPPTHANPNCDPTGLVTPQFTYTNDQPNIAGTATSGYFLPGVKYNVCVYFVNPPVLTLTGNGSPTSTTITTTGTVVYAGYANAAPNTTVGLKVFHGSDCGIGQDFYTDPSYTTTNASGNYSKESGTPPGAGLYSARTNVGSKLSNCINIGVDEFHLSLAITPNTIPSGTANPVTFSGNLTNPGSTPVAGNVVTVTAYGTDSTCTTPWIYGPWTAAAGASGQYATDPIPTGAPDGDYYYKASSMGVVSGCEHFTIG